jgi:hypothetical protein
MHQGRSAQIWRAGGMIWLISITFFFASVNLHFAKLSSFQTTSLGALILVISIILFIWSIKNLHLAKNISNKKSEREIQKAIYTRKWFLIILITEVVGLNIASIALWKSNHFQYIVPVDILIVALHFIPLGHIFLMPIYYFLGIIVALIVTITIFIVPASSQIGNLITVVAIPSLCFIFLNWICIIYILRDGMKYLRKL